MTNYEFEPGAKHGRNKFVGSWTETPAPPIELPYTAANLVRLLAIIAEAADDTYTHQQIARWCDLFGFHFYDDPSVRDRTTELDVAEDVSAQWDLTLANTYSLAELQSLDFTAVKLPTEWFVEWHSKLTSAAGG